MLTASDVMTTDVISVPSEMSVREIAKLLYTRRISGVPVVAEDQRVIGIVSEGDLVGHAEVVGEQRRSWWLVLFSNENALARDYAKTHGRCARDVMTSLVITVAPDASLAEIATTLERHRIKRVPVVQDGKLVGIVTRGNLLKVLATTEHSNVAGLDDRTIHEQILAELNTQSWAHLLTKNIVVRDGVVDLEGFVHDDDERRAMTVAAANVPGVKRVEDHMRHYPAMLGR
jgi:CBS domain-containing protein